MHDGFFTYTFTFFNPQLNDDTGDLVIQMRCRTQGGRYVVPYSRNAANPAGHLTKSTAELRFSQSNLVFMCHDPGWLRLCHTGGQPPPWGLGDTGLVMFVSETAFCVRLGSI